ncbi:type IV pilus modification protein PilV [Pseudoalteromonas sp. MMG022]|uniref:type IV pilus modification protein PilV n=1 Tax=Pseudoalteromonas sp. MMG022 TaxID=2909978 RepID=UPI001F259529|nr:type IV pilus modification protein PilV [Pseudoalteromonas sp. MMG022]MCF6436319.1 type IV pilus modification protein PilV [Pseudoalteromonas sp. MMG022]
MRITSSHNKGFTLLEVLIAFMVLSFGLLGAVALQAKAKQASFDAMQRAAALALAKDIVQRLRVNDTQALSTHYKVVFSSSSTLNPVNRCFSQQCDSTSIAAMDIEHWRQAIRARENTGSLDNTTVCITPSVVGGTRNRGYNVEVVVAWQGKQAMKASSENQAIDCGEKNDKRRLVVINSYVLVRA